MEKTRLSTKSDQRLKAEHKIVLRALEVANIAYTRVATVSEVIAALSLSENDVKRIKKAYKKNLGQTVSSILNQLYVRQVVFSPGRIGANRYYGSVNALAPESRDLPKQMSRRQRVLELVRNTVAQLNRAVRTSDVLKYVAEHPEIRDLSEAEITHDVLSLKETGELKVVGNPLRKDNQGTHLYLPSDLDPTQYMPTEALTWLDQVLYAFRELWNENLRQAAAENRLPRPISTGEVRTRLLSDPHPHENLKNPKLLVNAMIQLSQTEAAAIRKIKRAGQKASLWAPCDVPDEMLDIIDAYANDAERIGEAVRRAVERLGRPVTQRDVSSEIKMDDTLEPVGSSSLFQIISDASKGLIGGGDGTRRERVLQRVYQVGRVNGDAYYYHSADGVKDAYAFVFLRQIESRWLIANANEQLCALDVCVLPSVAIGRAMMIAADAQDALQELDQLLNGDCGDAVTRRDAEELRDQVDGILNRTHEWLNSRDSKGLTLPSEVSKDVAAWTAEELLPVMMPLYPQAQDITDPNQLIRLLYGEIRRVPNPKYQNRFAKDRHLAAEFLFDRTDALLYAAKKWGGHECCLQAMLAGSQLGWLRDERFVFPALELTNYESRLTAVACLAFLQSEDGNKRLRQIAVEDNNPSVREAALWACGFAGVEEIKELLRSRSKDDPNRRVRNFATAALEQVEISWWAM
jgi:HEAT repeats